MAIDDAPTVVRFPKGNAPAAIPAVREEADYDVLFEQGGDGADSGKKVLIVSFGALAAQALAAAQALCDADFSATVVDPHWVIPTSENLLELAKDFDLVVTIEDNGIHGGAGSTLQYELSAAGIDVPVRILGVPQKFLAHASRGEVLEELGLDVDTVVDTVLGYAQKL